MLDVRLYANHLAHAVNFWATQPLTMTTNSFAMQSPHADVGCFDSSGRFATRSIAATVKFSTPPYLTPQGRLQQTTLQSIPKLDGSS
jgi:hypothetical protein